jgi:hypothetical protein
MEVIIMSIAADLLKASHIGIREFKGLLTAKSLKEPLIITDRGIPISVSLPYSDVIELVDILEEIADPKTVSLVQEGRRTVKNGAKVIPAADLFKKMREHNR